MENLLLFIDNAILWEQAGKPDKAIRYWKWVIELVEEFNEGQAVEQGRFLVNLANGKIAELEG